MGEKTTEANISLIVLINTICTAISFFNAGSFFFYIFTMLLFVKQKKKKKKLLQQLEKKKEKKEHIKNKEHLKELRRLYNDRP